MVEDKLKEEKRKRDEFENETKNLKRSLDFIKSKTKLIRNRQSEQRIDELKEAVATRHKILEGKKPWLEKLENSRQI